MRILVAQISQSLLQILVIVLLTKTASLEFVGIYGVYSAFINSFYQLFKFGVPKVILASSTESNVRSYVRLGGLLAFCLFVILALIINGLHFVTDYDALGIEDNENLYFFLSILIYRSLQLFREVCHSFYLQNESTMLYWQSMFNGNIGALFAFAVSLYVANSPLYGFAGASIVFVLFSLRDYRKIFLNKSDFLEDESPVKNLALLKIALSDFLNSFKSSLPRILLAEVLSYTIAGVYTAIQQAVALLEILNQAFLKYYNRDIVDSLRLGVKRKFLVTALRIVGLIVITSMGSLIVCYFLGEPLLTFAFNDNYTDYKGVLLLLIVLRSLNMMTSLPKFILIIQNKVSIGIILNIVMLSASVPFLFSASSISVFIVYLITFETLYLVSLTLYNRQILRIKFE